MWVYILKCADGSYYTGVTNNLERRITEHQYGAHDGYTSVRLPVELVFSQEISNPLDAIAAEKQIKGWSRAKKEALIRADFNLLHELAECKNESHSKNKN
ncbi:MAG: GIY-YIG nuclease family protein [Ignavibacteriales bacterium]|nr:GIY-YIG nuclease family protein [Ignavibacteriales bacterium]